MKGDRIEIIEELGYSRLFVDFLNDHRALRPFVAPEPVEAKLLALSKRNIPREKLADLLSNQNKSWQAPAEVFESIAKLKDDRAVTIMTGQQAGLFGGPYLTILKALGAVKRARRLERELSVPVVPIFWIAADDHDFEEISSVDIFNTSGESAQLAIDFDPETSYPPMGRMSYDSSITREIDRFENLLPDNDFKQTVLDLLRQCYRSEKNIVDCFAEYLLSLIGHFGIVPLNPHDRDFKILAAPFMESVIGHHREMKTALAATEKELAGAGYHLQVKKASSATHLFIHRPERKPLHRDESTKEEADYFTDGDSRFSPEELIEQINTEPYDFSPDVISRPLLQSYLFPAVEVIGGPAEVAYFAQIMPLFDLFNLVRPQIMRRPSLTLVESRFEKLWKKHNLSYQQVTIDIERTIKSIVEEGFSVGLEKRLDGFSGAVKGHFKSIREELIAFDPTLNDTATKTGERIDFQIKQLKQKALDTHKKKNKDVRRRLTKLGDHFYPHRAPAERSIAIAYFVSRYGEGILDFIYESMDIDETGHQLLTLSGYHG
ncbi:MAG: bacillithiol biosynthesis cysteine-adding enzyme BshC [FCB group bacterium]|nr:bacillithiol biosynthesis cysteine-adding enzyme BshC [FCB group bacterium]